nr:uncharacterized protein LOC111999226 [Quercus suber]
MAVYSKDEALMCKVFPSSLGPIAMRWFNGLKEESINSFNELTQAFGSRFVTCKKVPRSLASLLSLSIQEGENLKMYSDRYWELFNEIEGDFDNVAISTFKLGLPSEHGLRQSLTEDCRSLWNHLDQLIRESKLKQLLHHFSGQGIQASSEPCRDDYSRPPLETINVIFTAPGRTGSWPSRILSMARLSTRDVG